MLGIYPKHHQENRSQPSGITKRHFSSWLYHWETITYSCYSEIPPLSFMFICSMGGGITSKWSSFTCLGVASLHFLPLAKQHSSVAGWKFPSKAVQKQKWVQKGYLLHPFSLVLMTWSLLSKASSQKFKCRKFGATFFLRHFYYWNCTFLKPIRSRVQSPASKKLQ